jgi:hypothetical protein
MIKSITKIKDKDKSFWNLKILLNNKTNYYFKMKINIIIKIVMKKKIINISIIRIEKIKLFFLMILKIINYRIKKKFSIKI